MKSSFAAKLFIIAANVLTGTAASAETENLLIGKWQIVDPNCSAMQRIVYTADTWSGFESDAGVYPGWRTLAVSYVASAEEVWVHTDGNGNDIRSLILDADHMKPDDGDGCVYERVK